MLKKPHSLIYKKAYGTYKGMLTRCNYTKALNYYRYGGRGIEVKISRENFIDWYIKKSKGYLNYTVDRIDNNGHYEINNIRLISRRANIQKAYIEIKKIRKISLQNCKRANEKRKIQVVIGEKRFSSLNEAGRFYGCQAYIKNRIRKYDSKMPNGTKILTN